MLDVIIWIMFAASAIGFVSYIAYVLRAPLCPKCKCVLFWHSVGGWRCGHCEEWFDEDDTL